MPATTCVWMRPTDANATAFDSGPTTAPTSAATPPVPAAPATPAAAQGSANLSASVPVNDADAAEYDLSSAFFSGGAHTLAIVSPGTLYAVGLNATGQLGNGQDNRARAHPSPVAVRLPPTVAVVHVACGEEFSAAVTREGQLFMWGFGGSGKRVKDFGDLFLGVLAPRVKKLREVHVAAREAWEAREPEPEEARSVT